MDNHGSGISQGSGFILTPDGLAGSNYHVLKGAERAVAECSDGRTFEIRSIEGADLQKDLVIFQLYEHGSQTKPTDLPHVKIGSSEALTVGERVIAIGAPQGLENTVSDGILSAVREYDSIHYLQITAPISPGSSGGPVLDSSGQMIGIATFQFKKGQNLNFAISTDHLLPLFEQHLGASLHEFQLAVNNGQAQKIAANGSANGNVSLRPVSSILNGSFGGFLHNQSADLSAEFGIVIRDDDGLLTGCMGVKRPLFGSGALVGSASGSEVEFVVSSGIGTITFVGQRKGSAITGTYTVNQTGGVEQQGDFALGKVKSKETVGTIDPAQCPTDADMNR